MKVLMLGSTTDTNLLDIEIDEGGTRFRIRPSEQFDGLEILLINSEYPNAPMAVIPQTANKIVVTPCGSEDY